MRTSLHNLIDAFRTAGSRILHPPAAGWICGGGLLLGIVLLMGFSGDFLRSRVHTPVDSVTIRFLDAPSWIGDSLHDHLTDLAAPRLLGTPLDRMDLINAREALIASGCFAEVRQVRRTNRATIEIDATFLKPRARVLSSSGPLLIDREGFVLPAGYRVATDTHLVNVLNPAYGAPETTAGRWMGADINASLQLLELLDDLPWYDQVKAMDLGQFDEGEQIVLVTDLGTRIKWGSPPGREAALEAMARDKISRLDWFNTHHGRIDQNHRGELDLTNASIVIKR